MYILTLNVYTLINFKVLRYKIIEIVPKIRAKIGEIRDMDIFDVLKAVLNRKMEFVRSGIDEKDALKRAEYDVSKEYNILLADVKKIDKSDILNI